MDKNIKAEIEYARTKEGQRYLRQQIENDACLRDEKRMSIPTGNEGSPYWNWTERKLNKDGMFSQELSVSNPDSLAESKGLWAILNSDNLTFDEVVSKLDTLSLHERRVLMLMSDEGMTVKEVAEHLNVSKKSIEKTVERFRKKLGDK